MYVNFLKYLSINIFILLCFFACIPKHNEKKTPINVTNSDSKKDNTDNNDLKELTFESKKDDDSDNERKAIKRDLFLTHELFIINVDLDNNDYPLYIDTKEVEKKFKYISVQFEYFQNIESVGNVVNSITFFRHDGEKQKEIGKITREGIKNINDDHFIYPNALSPDRNFMKQSFVGFSGECITDPFVLYGVALFSDTYEYYKTELLMNIDIDFKNEKLILYYYKIE